MKTVTIEYPLELVKKIHAQYMHHYNYLSHQIFTWSLDQMLDYCKAHNIHFGICMFTEYMPEPKESMLWIRLVHVTDIWWGLAPADAKTSEQVLQALSLRLDKLGNLIRLLENNAPRIESKPRPWWRRLLRRS